MVAPPLTTADIAAMKRVEADYRDHEYEDVYYVAYSYPDELRMRCTLPEIRAAMYRFEAAMADLYPPIRMERELSQSAMYREMRDALVTEP